MRLIPLAGSIRGRLYVAGATFGALLLLAGIAGWWSTHELSRAMRRTLDALRVTAELASEFSGAIALEIQAGHQYLDHRDPTDLATFQDLSHTAHGVAVRMNRGLGPGAEETALIARIDQLLALAETYYARAHRLADLGRQAEALRQSELAAPVTRQLLADLQRLTGRSAHKVAELTRRMEADIRRRRVEQVAVLVGFLLLALALGRELGRSISRPLDAMVDHARRLSRGDFSARTPTEDLPAEFRLLAEAMNREGEALTALSQREVEVRNKEKQAAVGRLVSGVAHEMADPLAGVQYQAELLLEERPGPEARRALEEIRSHTLKARRVVRDLLSFVKDRVAAPEPALLRDLVERAVGPAGLGDSLAKSRVEVVNDIPAGRFRLMVDRVGIEQVIANLVLNAAQASGPGGRVRLRAEPAGDSVALIVEDNGPGIPAAVLDRIFEPFFSGRGGEAPGLGLSAALGIVEQHGGTLRAENGAPGRDVGARFTVTLPRLLDTAEHAVVRVPEPAAAPMAARRPRVLVVEPEAGTRSSLRRHFAAGGWRVDEARTAEEAMTLLMPANAPEDFALLIGDLAARCADEEPLYRRLLRERPDVLSRFVHLSAQPQSRETRTLMTATGCRILGRPPDIPELTALVAEWRYARV
jgi:signal transduction histidine kinase